MALKEQLEQAGYDTAGLDETDLMAKLDQAGYDTSPLQAEKPVSMADGLMGGISETMKAANPISMGLDLANKASNNEEAMAQGSRFAGAAEYATPGGLAQKGFDFGGEKIAESLSPMVGPNLAALAGTTFAMLPDAIGAFVGGVKPSAKAVKGLTDDAAELARPVTRKVGEIVDAVKDTGAKQVSKLQVEKAELPLKQIARKETLEASRSAAGKEIQKAEELLSIGQKTRRTEDIASIIKSPEKTAKFADRAAKLADKGPEWLAERASPEALQFYRKTAESAAKRGGNALPTEARNKLFQIKKVFTEAIGKTEAGKKAGFDKASGSYNEIDKLVRNLPKEFDKEKKMLEATLARARALKEKQAPLRKGAGIVGRAVTYGAGATAAAAAIKKVVKG